MFNTVKNHYESYPYPTYPLIASVNRSDTYALNLTSLWARFNDSLPPSEAKKILIAGCGTFAPYPWSVANPDIPITALDLSDKSLLRAARHCRLHLCNNIIYRCGDLTDGHFADSSFGLIDSFGVLHHLENPLAGLKALEKLLVPGGILRIMVYSRYARKEEESIRRSLRLLGIKTPEKARALFKRAATGSRLENYLSRADEPATRSGLADALLHPRVRTFRINDLKEMVDLTNLEILMFAHYNALEKPSEEIERIRSLEKERYSDDNFILYLGKKGESPVAECRERVIILNPCLRSSVSRLKFGKTVIASRLGVQNPTLHSGERDFLRRFTTPVRTGTLSVNELERVAVYKRLLFLIDYPT
ncbi:MAG: class I SAM-dependent methyltransferase [Desulfuromonadaceae bacterium]|nr:class I SAM-dependent methyltransferase [Desulfuromonadaceae bacterium]MDD2855677.1 class I SAM-dependent methyltransferase [Desulfuromonadaceae bacterium]